MSRSQELTEPFECPEAVPLHDDLWWCRIPEDDRIFLPKTGEFEKARLQDTFAMRRPCLLIGGSTDDNKRLFRFDPYLHMRTDIHYSVTPCRLETVGMTTHEQHDWALNRLAACDWQGLETFCHTHHISQLDALWHFLHRWTADPYDSMPDPKADSYAFQYTLFLKLMEYCRILTGCIPTIRESRLPISLWVLDRLLQMADRTVPILTLGALNLHGKSLSEYRHPPLIIQKNTTQWPHCDHDLAIWDVDEGCCLGCLSLRDMAEIIART